jgi:hypothetical protein
MPGRVQLEGLGANVVHNDDNDDDGGGGGEDDDVYMD